MRESKKENAKVYNSKSRDKEKYFVLILKIN